MLDTFYYSIPPFADDNIISKEDYLFSTATDHCFDCPEIKEIICYPKNQYKPYHKCPRKPLLIGLASLAIGFIIYGLRSRNHTSYHDSD